MTQPPSASSPIQPWLLASRPKTLPAVTAAVLVGIAAAWAEGAFRPGPALAALLVGLLLQIGANLANDVFDYLKGADTHERLGPTRVTQAGLLRPRQVLAGMWITFGLAGLLGLYLAFQAGWPVIAIGLLAILAAVTYTGGPLPYGYYGLGELFVFLFFGITATAGTYFVQARAVSPLALGAAVPMGLLATALLTVNNYRDMATDQASGKRTLAVRFGGGWTRAQYLICVALAYLAPLALWLGGLAGPWVLLSWLSLVRLPPLVRAMFHDHGRALNRTLAGTGQLELWFGILLAIGLVV